MSKFNPASAIYTPAETSDVALRQIEYIKKNEHKRVDFFIPGIDQYFAPLLPRRMYSVIAQTSNYKSGFIYAWEYALAKQLMEQGRNDEIIVHVSVEESIEEQAYLLFGMETGEDVGEIARGNVDEELLRSAAVKIGTIPIYRIGESMERADFPDLYLSNVLKSLDTLQDKLLGRPLKIAAIYFDYLQAFPFDPEIKRLGNKEVQRRLQVREDIYRIRQAGAVYKCPTIVAVQAKQVLNGAPSNKMYIPGIYDGEESSAIGQRSDGIIQLWMPKMNHPLGTLIEYNDLSYTVEENILWVKVGKQRGRLPSGRAWKCRVKFSKNIILPETIGGYDPFGE